MMGRSKTLRRSEMVFITFVQTITQPFTSHGKLYNYSKPKQFF
jgi:hypothetical protein